MGAPEKENHPSLPVLQTIIYFQSRQSETNGVILNVAVIPDYILCAAASSRAMNIVIFGFLFPPRYLSLFFSSCIVDRVWPLGFDSSPFQSVIDVGMICRNCQNEKLSAEGPPYTHCLPACLPAILPICLPACLPSSGA
jgi:hypothetical protein